MTSPAYAGVLKPVLSIPDALSVVQDGMTVMIGGFGGAGSPVELVHGLIDTGKRDLVVVNNNAGNGQVGLAALIREKRVRKMICSFPRSSDSSAFRELYEVGEIELEVVPQGTLAERIRAAGAGVPAFFTPTGFGTPLAAGKEAREFGGRTYIMEHALHADIALVKAARADRAGNLTFSKSARNFGPIMCAAAAVSIVQAGEIVDAGAIDAEIVVTPGIFVDRLVHVPDPSQEEDLVAKGVRYP
jgi:3-oxoadipate CoA-transferase alpha subunit